jgi:hypothetical protein
MAGELIPMRARRRRYRVRIRWLRFEAPGWSYVGLGLVSCRNRRRRA